MDLSEINKALPKKAVTILATKLGVSHTLVSLVLSGKRQNDLVIDAALDLIEECKKKHDQRIARLQNLTS
ncbi:MULTISPECIES: hypothetical protein [Sphingobacterium]|uniref:hypothetical protein n=1 Tax=Sphingobacterium TaxID=28453 RepID=UPI000EECAFE8|nr:MULTISPECIES: hypothetical protein [Sphingobacterium]HAF34223.1 hypothetical protein [Sphingobacterium sp.]